MYKDLNSISNRIERVSTEGKKITELGKEWSSLGHEVRRAKKEHKQAINSLMNEVQLKLEI